MTAAATTDIAARTVIKAKYGEMFTHRVGYGFDIKVHDSVHSNREEVDDIL